MKLGSKIRELRLKRSSTQEQMAKVLGVTTQCVSKWETGTTMPDIELLPLISAYLGVTIDELFDLTDDVHIDRIQNMMNTCKVPDKMDFAEAESFLMKKIGENPNNTRYHTILAELYISMADGYRSLAEMQAIRAIELAPEEKYNHSLLRMAQQGTLLDWNLTNHTKRINYYKEFVKKHPLYEYGYNNLLDELCADGRLAEAEHYAELMEQNCDGSRGPFYHGFVKYCTGREDDAWEIWNTMLSNHGDWLAYSKLGDVMARSCQYEKAIEYYKKSAELKEKPRYIDEQTSIAVLYEIQGKYAEAIEAWETVISILEEDYGLKECTTIDDARAEIIRLKNLE